MEPLSAESPEFMVFRCEWRRSSLHHDDDPEFDKEVKRVCLLDFPFTPGFLWLTYGLYLNCPILNSNVIAGEEMSPPNSKVPGHPFEINDVSETG